MTLSHEMKGDDDRDSFHLGVFDADKLLCIGSFIRHSNDYFQGTQFQLRGMATAAEAQGKGYGKLLLAEAEQLLKNKNIQILWCNARVSAHPFYLKMGYRIKGDVFEVPEVGKHFVMYKPLD